MFAFPVVAVFGPPANGRSLNTREIRYAACRCLLPRTRGLQLSEPGQKEDTARSDCA